MQNEDCPGEVGTVEAVACVRAVEIVLNESLRLASSDEGFRYESFGMRGLWRGDGGLSMSEAIVRIGPSVDCPDDH